MSEYVEVSCPFCGEDDFDLIGLKYHLSRSGCVAYEALELCFECHKGYESLPLYGDTNTNNCPECRKKFGTLGSHQETKNVEKAEKN